MGERLLASRQFESLRNRREARSFIHENSFSRYIYIPPHPPPSPFNTNGYLTCDFFAGSASEFLPGPIYDLNQIGQVVAGTYQALIILLLIKLPLIRLV